GLVRSPSMRQRLEQRAGGARSVRVLRLPLVAELCHRPLLALRDEDRIEPEALDPSWRVRNATFERARASELLAPRGEGDQLADITGAAPVAGDPLHLAQQPADL